MVKQILFLLLCLVLYVQSQPGWCTASANLQGATGFGHCPQVPSTNLYTRSSWYTKFVSKNLPTIS